MRRGSLLLIVIASAIGTLVSLNLIFGRLWNYYDGYGYRGHYCNQRYDRDAGRNHQRNQDGPAPDSATGKY